jgi:hypothetical protein
VRRTWTRRRRKKIGHYGIPIPILADFPRFSRDGSNMLNGALDPFPAYFMCVKTQITVFADAVACFPLLVAFAEDFHPPWVQAKSVADALVFVFSGVFTAFSSPHQQLFVIPFLSRFFSE